MLLRAMCQPGAKSHSTPPRAQMSSQLAAASLYASAEPGLPGQAQSSTPLGEGASAWTPQRVREEMEVLGTPPTHALIDADTCWLTGQPH